MSSLIKLLYMLKGDIKKHANEKAGTGMLTGQTITEEEIISLPAYKLMTIEERQVIHSILDNMKKESSKNIKEEVHGVNNSVNTGESMTRDKVLLKQIDGIVPFPKNVGQDTVVDYKDAA